MDRVEKIMADCFERPLEDWSEAIGAACEQHPDLAGEIIARYTALQAMGLSSRAPSDEFPDELGHFRLHERLGGGGMGVVYRATDQSLAREVALKLIRPEILYFENARERFQREVEAVARLQHPSIISVYSVGEEFGVPYFAMELLDGRTIAEVLREFSERAPASLTGGDLFRALGGDPDGELPEPFQGTWVEACIAVVIQVARALEHAHGRGVLHRDIKPSNIILLRDGRAILLDFGLASSAQPDVSRRMTRPGTPVGTLHYMSGEQLIGKVELDERADVYSLGVMLYEMLTLQVPFAGETPLEIQARVLAGDADPIQARNRRVPVDVVTVCRTAMRRYPGDRYPSAAAFADDLTRARDHLPIQARPPGALVRSLRWMQRNRAASLAGAALLTFAVGLPSGLLIQQRAHAAELTASLVEAQEALDFTVSMLLDLTPEQAAEDASARGLLERGVSRVPEVLAHNPRGRAKIQTMIGRVLFFWNDYEAAIEPLRGAIEVLREQDDESAPRELMEALETLGIVLANLARYDEADAALAEAVELAEQLFGPGSRGDGDAPGDPDDAFALATAYVLQAESFQMQNRLGEALESARLGLELKRRADPEPENLATTVGLVATILQQLGRADEAGDEMEELYATLRETGARDSILYANFLSSFGFLRMGQRRFDESEQLYRTAIEIETRLLGPNSPTLADTMAHYARTLSWKGDHAASAEAYERTVAIASTYGGPASRDLQHAELRLAQELVTLERWDEALTILSDLVPRMRDTYGDDNRLTGFALEAIARCHLAAGDLDAAENALLEAYDIVEGVRTEAEMRVAVRNGLVHVYRARGESELVQQFLAEAIELAPRAVVEDPAREALALGIEIYGAQGRALELARCRKLLEDLDRN